MALRCKSVQTATHGLRVSLLASGWATGLRLPEGLREAIEVAALLHDVGMIGLPDEILRKPGSLDADEQRMVDEARKMSVEILRNACAQHKVLEIVEYIPAWYDGSRDGYSLKGDDLPLGARMIAIAEAFDAMTTDQVYRPAMSLERAGFELFAGAGVQFDPKLVNGFAEFHSGNLDRIREEARRTLAPYAGPRNLQLLLGPSPIAPPKPRTATICGSSRTDSSTTCTTPSSSLMLPCASFDGTTERNA